MLVHYALLQHCPDIERQEGTNVGVLLLPSKGDPVVRITAQQVPLDDARSTAVRFIHAGRAWMQTTPRGDPWQFMRTFAGRDQRAVMVRPPRVVHLHETMTVDAIADRLFARLVCRDLTIAGTGHRPDKLGGYGDVAQQRLVDFARTVIQQRRPTTIISGMALGWDQALAWAAIAEGVPFHAYLPFEGMEAQWPAESRAKFVELRAKASKEVIVCDGGYAPWKMQRRNQAMVDALPLDGQLWALWNGSSGGTANCVDAARKSAKNAEPLFPKFWVSNLWSEWTTNA